MIRALFVIGLLPAMAWAESTRVTLDHGSCLVDRPASLMADAPAPLLFCLHGTGEQAEDMIAFWRSIESDLPFIVVAPEAGAAGWSDSDLPLLQDTLRHIRTSLHYDPERVLLVGHSAGAALALHLLYAEDFPAAALAASAGYLPPTVTPTMISAHAQVPVLCTLAAKDDNRPAMEQLVATLRKARVNVKTAELPSGHELTTEGGRAIVKWFEEVCQTAVERRLQNAKTSLAWRDGHGRRMADVEDVIDHVDVYRPEHLAEAKSILQQLEQPARKEFLEIDRMLNERRPFDARRKLIELEEQYQPASIVKVMHYKQKSIESDPKVARSLGLDPAQPEGWMASYLLQRAEWAVDRGRIANAIQLCEQVSNDYPDADAADEARKLLASLTGQQEPNEEEGAAGE